MPAAHNKAAVGQLKHLVAHQIALVDYRPYLQPVEVSADTVAVGYGKNIAGELDLHRALHRILSLPEHEIDGRGKRHHLVAQYIGESNHPSAAAKVAVAKHVVSSVVGAGGVTQGAFACKILHILLLQRSALIDLCCKFRTLAVG